jgi:hypothetical protein
MKLGKEDMATIAALGHGSHDIKWADAVRLIEHLGSISDHGKNKALLKVGDQKVILNVPSGKSLTTEEMAELRHFLRTAGVNFSDPSSEYTSPSEEDASEPGYAAAESPWIVVIDHHAARIYSASESSRPDPIGTVKPLDPHGFHRHLVHRSQTRLQGQRIPEDHAFYEEIAQVLAPAPSIILVGDGTGKSNAAAFLKHYLEHHHSTIAGRVISEERADLSGLTDPQIEAIAERYRSLTSPHRSG